MEFRLMLFIAVLLLLSAALILGNAAFAGREREKCTIQNFPVHSPALFCLYGIVPLLVLAGLMAILLLSGRAVQVPGWGIPLMSLLLVVPYAVVALQPVSGANGAKVEENTITVRTYYSKHTYTFDQIRACTLEGEKVSLYVIGRDRAIFTFDRNDEGYALLMKRLSDAGIPVTTKAVL